MIVIWEGSPLSRDLIRWWSGQMGVEMMPEKYQDSNEWPKQLRIVVRILGPQHVWDRGLATLGYPPTMVLTEQEATVVRDASFQGA